MIKFGDLLECDKSNIKINDKRKKNKCTIPWVDKYRPTKLSEVVYQNDVVKMLNNVLENGNLPHLLFHGSPGTGKCLDPETPIIMFNGSIKLAKEIKTGDLLMGDNNKPRNVLSTIKGEDTMYKIIQENGDNYIVNSEHIISLKLSIPFLIMWIEKEKKYTLFWFEKHDMKQLSCVVENNNKNSESFKTKKLAYNFICRVKQMLINNNIANKKGDICDICILDYLKKPNKWKHVYKGFKCGIINCWNKKEVEFDPYVLGYSFRNGSNNTYNSTITTSRDIIVSHSNMKFTKRNNIYLKCNSQCNRNVTIAINKNQIRHIPIDYKINDIETRLLLLAGFLDANGHFDGNNNFEFEEQQKQLFDEIIFIARSLGLMVSVKTPQIIDGTIYYGASIYGNGVENIPTKILKKCTHKQEYKQNKNSLVYNIQIQKLEKGMYCGFEIDNNKRFLLGDFTVTHNTSSILAIAMELFGPKKYNERVIELNASDERGINIVRNKIVTLAKSAISANDPNYLCPSYKIIILDEADAMTNEAQSALRKTMEDNSTITRFCFICNYINQIIDPITSRCVKFRFKPIDEKNMMDKLIDIADKEKMVITNHAVKIISNVSNGDMRKAIMLLQNLNYLNKNIDIYDVYEIANMVPCAKMNEIINKCVNDSTNTLSIRNLANEFSMSGYPINIILSQLIDCIVKNKDINDKMKSQICLHIANTEKRLIDGADEYLQLLSIFMCIKSVVINIESIYLAK